MLVAIAVYPLFIQTSAYAAAPDEMQAAGECAVTAVSLIGAWVNAGAAEGSFPFTATDGQLCTGDFSTDVLPLFSTDNIWFEGSEACTNCHFDNSEDSRHEMDLSSLEGILRGADALSEPPGVPVVVPGDWENSKLRARLRDNRMPPGWEFDIEETNRDGPTLTVDGAEVTAVSLIGAWVDSGAEEGLFEWADDAGTAHTASFADDVQPLFTTENAWFEGSEACTNCHFDNSEDSRHEMDLSNIAGILRGADALSEPPGVPIVVPGDWEHSKLRSRLRDNRMPPGWEFDIEETNRDGPTIMAGVKAAAPTAAVTMSPDDCNIYAVDLIGAWVDAGAKEGTFTFTDVNGQTCTGDFNTNVQPLFTTDNIWFEGSEACTNCHFDNSEDSRHEMDLSSLEGILRGADALSEPPGVPIIVPGDWEGSKLRSRLRDNRMPPGWEFDIEETNRDGPTLTVDGVEITAVSLIGANEGGHLRLHLLTSDGTLLWAVDTIDGFLKSVALDDKQLYYLAYTDMVYGLSLTDGAEVWHYPTENWSPGFTMSDGTLYFGSDNARVHAVAAEEGTAVWQTPLEGIFNAPRSEPNIVGDYLYFQSNDNRLYGLNRLSGAIVWQSEPQPRSRIPLTVAGSQLYLATQDGVLLAYK
ncbi:MAG: c-type cytochrome domain-containing protein [Chloroflexota bacterium]